MALGGEKYEVDLVVRLWHYQTSLNEAWCVCEAGVRSETRNFWNALSDATVQMMRKLLQDYGVNLLARPYGAVRSPYVYRLNCSKIESLSDFLLSNDSEGFPTVV
jgi:hypothetical protein